MVLSTLSYCSLVVAGVGGFMYFSFSEKALISLSLSGLGVLGIIYNIHWFFEKRAVWFYMADELRDVLVNKTLLELIAEGKLIKKIKQNVAEILPVFLATTDEERYDALENMSESTRRFFTVRGISNNFPAAARDILLPREIRNRQIASKSYLPPLDFHQPHLTVSRNPELISDGNPESNAVTSAVITSNGPLGVEKLSSHKNRQEQENEKERRLARQHELTSELFKRLAKRSNMHVVLSMVNPDACKIIVLLCAALLLLQIAISHRSREIAIQVSRVFAIIGCVLGIGGGFGLIIFHKYAKVFEQTESERLDELKRVRYQRYPFLKDADLPSFQN